MPKKKKERTKTLYTYVKPVNNTWVRTQAKRLKIPGGYSAFVDFLLTQARMNSTQKQA